MGFPNTQTSAGIWVNMPTAGGREALQRYLAPPSTGGLKTIAAIKAYYNPQAPKQGGDPSFLEVSERAYDGLRKVGMPEG